MASFDAKLVTRTGITAFSDWAVYESTATTLTVAATPNPTVALTPITLTATLTPAGSGAVQFYLDGAALGSAQALTSGVANLVTTTIPVGSHAITATYAGEAMFLPSQGALAGSLMVNPIATTLSMTAAANPSVHGETVVLTATVVISGTGAGTPTGAVTFTVDASELGVVDVAANGVATVTTSSLGVGAHTIAATYSGDANFVGSSDVLTQTVERAATTTVLASAPTPTVFGEPVNFTATVTVSAPGAGTPTGVVTFTAGASELGIVDLAANGVATLTTNSLAAGEHTVAATYGGDDDFVASSGALTQTVDRAVTTTMLASAPNPSTYGERVIFTATVTVAAPGTGTPTGVVTFTPATGQLGVADLGANGVATFSTAGLAAGTHVVTATYSGDSNHQVSISTPVTQAVNQAATTTALVSTPTPSTFGETVTFTATVSGDVESGSVKTAIRYDGPTGMVTFTSGGGVLGAGALTNGVATFSTASLAAGSHVVTATYGGDANFLTSSDVLTQTVDRAATTTALASGPSPSTYGKSVIFTATVSSGVQNAALGILSGEDAPDGVVTFTTAAGELGYGNLSDGIATFATDLLAVGSHVVTATYGGDANYIASTSTPLTQLVARAVATATLESAPNPSIYGEEVAFTVTVSAARQFASNFGALRQAPDAPTGEVAFLINGVSVDVEMLEGVATVRQSALPAGEHVITATYKGDGNYLPALAVPITHTVERAAPSIALVNAPATTLLGESVTFTATVQAPVCGGTSIGILKKSADDPTGVVTFTAGAAFLGTGVLDANGDVDFTTDSLAVGTHVVTAAYGGDGNYQVVVSDPVTQTVNHAPVTVQVSADPAVGGTATGSETFDHGATVVVTATANAGYTFVNWTEGGVPVSTDAVYSFTVTGNRTLVANFILNQYTIGVSANPAAGGAVTGGGTYNHGATVVVAATANAGYTFVNWTEGGAPVSTDAVYSFTATGNRTLVANFTLNQYTIGVSTNPVQGGAATGGGTYNHGATVVVTATANTGYIFVNWTEGGVPVSTAAVYSFTANASRMLVANFAALPTPTAVNDAAGVIEGGAVDVAVLANDLDPAGGGLTVFEITQPAHGRASILSGSQAVRYAASAGFSGVDNFTYTMRDVNGQQSIGVVAVVVTPLNETDEAPQIAPVDPAVESTQHFTSSQATVAVDLPAGFYTGTVDPTQVFFLSYTPAVTPTQQTQTPPGTLIFGNFEFELTAFLDDQTLHGVQFAQPITLTIRYNPALMMGLNLETLGLYYWNGTDWSTDGIAILNHAIANATLTVAISHLSEFGLFAAPASPTALDPVDEPILVPCRLFLPAVISGAAQAADAVEQVGDVMEQEAPVSAPPITMLYLPVIGR